MSDYTYFKDGLYTESFVVDGYRFYAVIDEKFVGLRTNLYVFVRGLSGGIFGYRSTFGRYSDNREEIGHEVAFMCEKIKKTCIKESLLYDEYLDYPLIPLYLYDKLPTMEI